MGAANCRITIAATGSPGQSLLAYAFMKGKIINDPVYGFIRFSEPELLQVIAHPWFQRLRRIKQMGMAHLVYPGAVHTRFHHSLGACHLMGQALEVLRQKGFFFSEEECLAARLAILLHDVGHGPFSHALEQVLVSDIEHETISRLMIQKLSEELDGALVKALAVFEHSYPKKWMHQLVSSQLDMDRLDYLNRDSFYTGVSEGVIGYDRIIQMLAVADGQLVVEEKAVHSVEKFIISRRLMYWQVYLHKTVLGAEQLIINILKRAKELARQGAPLFATPALHHFLYNDISRASFLKEPEHLEKFCLLDDSDITVAIKAWQGAPDPTLSLLCRMLTNRRLYKTILSNQLPEGLLEEKRKLVRCALPQIPEENLAYFIFEGFTSSNTYSVSDERICILRKNGDVVDISEVENPLVTQALARPVVKNYICYFQ